MPRKSKLSPEQVKAALATPVTGELIPKPLRTRAKAAHNYELTLAKEMLVTPELIEDIQKHYSGGATIKQIAYALGITPDALYTAIRTNSALARAMHKGRLDQVSKLSAKAFQLAMKGDRILLIFLLKTIGRFSETWKANEDGEDVPVPPVLTLNVSDPVDAMKAYAQMMKDT